MRALVVDDQKAFREAAAALLGSIDNFEIIEQARSGEEAVLLAREHNAEFILMDVRLPGIDGLEATRQIMAANPSAIVVLVSTYDESDLQCSPVECGAKIFLSKSELSSDRLVSVAFRGD